MINDIKYDVFALWWFNVICDDDSNLVYVCILKENKKI